LSVTTCFVAGCLGIPLLPGGYCREHQPRLDPSLVPPVDERGRHLDPITYTEAMALYLASNKRPFSFLAGPYHIPKTIAVERGAVLASPPQAVFMQYAMLGQQRALGTKAPNTRRYPRGYGRGRR